MVNRRKIICFLLACLLILTVLPVGVFAASAQLTVTVPSSLPKKGQTFEVSISIEGNPGVCSLQFALHFDQTQMDCTDVVDSGILKNMLAVTNPDASDGARVAAASINPATGNGTFATFKFKALKDIDKFNFSLADLSATGADDKTLSIAVKGATAETSGTGSSGSQGGGSTTPEVKGGDFTDTANHKDRAYINRSAELGLFEGFTDGSFRPENKVTRAQFVVVFWRLNGSPKPSKAAPFKDIGNKNQGFKDAIAWAYENKVISGKSDTVFDPDGYVTKQQAITILNNYDGRKVGMESMFTAEYDKAFTDSAQVAAYAKAPLYWAYYNGIFDAPDNKLNPKEPQTRAQLAVYLVKYLDNYLK